MKTCPRCKGPRGGTKSTNGYCYPCAAAYATARRHKDMAEGKRPMCQSLVRAATPDTLTCSSCGEQKPNQAFAFNVATRAIYDYCRRCAKNKRAAAYRNKPGVADGVRAYLTRRRERERASGQYLVRTRAWRLANVYGMTVEQYDAMVEAQGGACAICMEVPSAKPSSDPRTLRLYVDHHHGTGAVRGLLCARCNTGIGFLGDSAENAERAAEYLRRTSQPELRIAVAP